ncbi:MAG TPA: hypothetical protein DGT21_24585 [Armatimonadetes bacterium]|nr:hypothetical protein [Armatimonadota bacterium]
MDSARAVVCMLVCLLGAWGAPADTGAYQFSNPARMVGGSALVPLREVCEWLGATVTWRDGGVVVELEQRHAELRNGTATAVINGAQVVLPAAPRIIGDMLHVPVRGVFEGLGAAVEWHSDGPRLEVVYAGRRAVMTVATASIEFTRVPPRGSSALLRGRAIGVDPGQYRIAVYIYVSGWWTKPYWDAPLTPLRPDGTWSCDVTTGGIDESATAISAYLVPRGYAPPLLAGDGVIPDELERHAVASVAVRR